MVRPLPTLARRVAAIGVAIALVTGFAIGCRTFTTRRDILERKKNSTEAGKAPRLDPDVLEDLFFDVHWETRVLRDAGETITYFELVDDAIYVYTDAFSLYALDFNSGMVRWKYEVGEELAFPVSVYNYPPEEKERNGLKVYDEVFFVSKDTLFGIDKENGSLLWKTRLPFSPASGPTASEGYVYVGSWDDRLYSIDKRDQRSQWFWRTDDDVTTRAVEKSPSVYMASDDGIVYSFDAVKGGPPNWIFKCERSVRYDPLMYRNRLYVGSDDMNIYSIGILDGLLEWRYPTGAPISRSPAACRNTIYVVSENNRLDAIHRRKGRTKDGKVYREGEVKWSYPLGLQFLAKGRENSYVLAERDVAGKRGLKIVALDEEEGFVRWDDDGKIAEEVDYFVTNQEDPLDPVQASADRGGILYFGFKGGVIIALKEKVKY